MSRDYKEKDFQSQFNKWAKNRWNENAVFELKVSPTESIPFNAVQEHQINALLNAKHASITFKIPDDSFSQKPFDSFHLIGVAAFIVVMFNCKEQNHKEFVMVDVDAWLNESKISERKSLTLARAKEIGTTYLLA